MRRGVTQMATICSKYSKEFKVFCFLALGRPGSEFHVGVRWLMWL